MSDDVRRTRWFASALKMFTERCPRLRPLLPAAVIAASWPACHAGEGPLVAFLGDSLTSGWRLSEDEAWPAVLGRTLTEQEQPIRVLNAGVSGEMADQGLARLDDVLAHEPDVLVVALGINDALRGRSLDEAEAALRRILDDGRASGAHLLLVGTRIPKEFLGAEYAGRFEEMYARLAAEHKVALVPDLLDGVAGHEELLFPDSLHPNAAGHVLLAETVRPHLELVLAEVAARSQKQTADD
jgi:acyl-CoA thioesterase-1